jgi:hypothetical protein
MTIAWPRSLVWYAVVLCTVSFGSLWLLHVIAATARSTEAQLRWMQHMGRSRARGGGNAVEPAVAVLGEARRYGRRQVLKLMAAGVAGAVLASLPRQSGRFIAKGLRGKLAGTVAGAELLQIIPPDPCDGCAWIESDLTLAECEAETEYVTVRICREPGSGAFKGQVCLIDFQNQPIRCLAPGEGEVAISERCKTVLLAAPPGTRVWQVRTYRCYSNGTIDIQSNDCLCDCCTVYRCEDGMCQEVPDCPEREGPPVYSNCECSTEAGCGSYWGQHRVKVKLDNRGCQSCRRIQYWWREEFQCQERDSVVYGTEIPAGQVIYLCRTLGVYGPDDGIKQFKYIDLSDANCDCGPNQGAITASHAGEDCCPAGQICDFETNCCSPSAATRRSAYRPSIGAPSQAEDVRSMGVTSTSQVGRTTVLPGRFSGAAVWHSGQGLHHRGSVTWHNRAEGCCVYLSRSAEGVEGRLWAPEGRCVT